MFLWKGKALAACCLVAALLLSGGCAMAAPPSEGVEGTTDVTITVNGHRFAASFYANAATRAILAQMPFTLDMEEYAAQEKVTALPFDVPAAPTEVPATVSPGQLYLWQGNSLVLFYTGFPNSYNYIPVGAIADAEGLVQALGGGTARVTFAASMPPVYCTPAAADD